MPIVVHFPSNWGGYTPKISPLTENVSPPNVPSKFACKSMFPPLSEMWRGHPCSVAGKVSKSAFPTKFGGGNPDIVPSKRHRFGGICHIFPSKPPNMQFLCVGGDLTCFHCPIPPNNSPIGCFVPPKFPLHFFQKDLICL